MTIPVLPVHQDDDGVWRPLAPVVFSTRDLDTFESLAAFTPEEAQVDTGEGLRRLTIYRSGSREGWVTLEALEAEAP